jgi:hypothetical protein
MLREELSRTIVIAAPLQKNLLNTKAPRTQREPGEIKKILSFISILGVLCGLCLHCAAPVSAILAWAGIRVFGFIFIKSVTT